MDLIVCDKSKGLAIVCIIKDTRSGTYLQKDGTWHENESGAMVFATREGARAAIERVMTVYRNLCERGL